EDHDPDAGAVGRRGCCVRGNDTARYVAEMGDQCKRCAGGLRAFFARRESGCDGEVVAGVFSGALSRRGPLLVIARSGATKQSIYPRVEVWIASLRSQ